jgi:hypothetical protein
MQAAFQSTSVNLAAYFERYESLSLGNGLMKFGLAVLWLTRGPYFDWFVISSEPGRVQQRFSAPVVNCSSCAKTSAGRTPTEIEAVTSKTPLGKQLRSRGGEFVPERCVQVVIRTTADVRGS